MKPAATISIVVVAVLTTVVIEELRIHKLRTEVLRLGKLPTDQPVSITPEEIIARETPLPGRETAALKKPPEVPSTAEEATSTQPSETPSKASPFSGGRTVPDDYPEPSEERIKEVALGPYSNLHYELGLTNRQRAYLDDLLGDRQIKQQAFAQAWVGAEGLERSKIEIEMSAHLAESDDALKAFFGKESDYRTFVVYHAMQPERSMLAQLLPMMDQQGVTLEISDEQKLVAAMYEARVEAEGIDWNSADALKAVVAGDAKERFETEWLARNEYLATALPEFLDEKTVSVVAEGLEQLKTTILESLDAAIEAVNGSAEPVEE